MVCTSLKSLGFIHRRPSVVLIANFYDLTLRCIKTGKPCMSTFAVYTLQS